MSTTSKGDMTAMRPKSFSHKNPPEQGASETNVSELSHSMIEIKLQLRNVK